MKKYCNVFLVVKTCEYDFYETSLFFKRYVDTDTKKYFEIYKKCYKKYPLSYRNCNYADFVVNNCIPKMYFGLVVTKVNIPNKSSKFYIKVI